MVDIPKNVLDLLGRQDSTKVLVTADKSGVPHAIVCGSIIAIDANTLVVGEILMKTSSKNLAANDKAAILAVNGMESYLVKVKVAGKKTEGPVFDNMNAHLAKMKLKANAVWFFAAESVFNQSAGPDAGKKLA
ncbi:MAG: hypothetical protein FWD37_06580 [Methanomassiliicoccaceae archaeon]|nr:hypothetical protein [Methanomassiliicoccaceae archaeon]